jgi:tRNA-splicing ligase RtcB
MKLDKNQVVVLIHCGSRGLGHQVCTDYVAQMGAAMKKYGITLPDRQLACVPIRSDEGKAYLSAMRASANFAWANRQGITHLLRSAFRRVFDKSVRMDLIYDVAHNIAKKEKHSVDGRKMEVLVHRKESLKLIGTPVNRFSSLVAWAPRRGFWPVCRARWKRRSGACATGPAA